MVKIFIMPLKSVFCMRCVSCCFDDVSVRIHRVKYSNLSNGLFTHWVFVRMPASGRPMSSAKKAENVQKIMKINSFSNVWIFQSRLGKNCRKSWRQGYFLVFTVFFISSHFIPINIYGTVDPTSDWEQWSPWRKSSRTLTIVPSSVDL